MTLNTCIGKTGDECVREDPKAVFNYLIVMYECLHDVFMHE